MDEEEDDEEVGGKLPDQLLPRSASPELIGGDAESDVDADGSSQGTIRASEYLARRSGGTDSDSDMDGQGSQPLVGLSHSTPALPPGPRARVPLSSAALLCHTRTFPYRCPPSIAALALAPRLASCHPTCLRPCRQLPPASDDAATGPSCPYLSPCPIHTNISDTAIETVYPLQHRALRSDSAQRVLGSCCGPSMRCRISITLQQSPGRGRGEEGE